jgi:hypothetical protein
MNEMWTGLGFIDVAHIHSSFAFENKAGKYIVSFNCNQKTTAVMGCHD